MKKQKADGFQNQYLFVIQPDFLDAQLSNPLFRHLYVTDIGLFPNARYHYRNRQEGSDTAILLFCTHGEGHYTLEGGTQRSLYAGQALFIPPGLPHEYAASQHTPWTIYWVHVQGTLIEHFQKTLDQQLLLTFDRRQETNIIELFDSSFQLLKRPIQSEEYFALCQTVGNILGLILLANKQTKTTVTHKGERAIQDALRYMKNQLHQSLTLADIATAANYSASHLNTLFKNITGRAPMEYFLHMKIQAASKDLYFTDRLIKDIALDYGISDPYYFSRLFKNIMGVSPQEYRDQIKG